MKYRNREMVYYVQDRKIIEYYFKSNECANTAPEMFNDQQTHKQKH